MQSNSCLQILAGSYKDDGAKLFSLMTDGIKRPKPAFWEAYYIRKKSFIWRAVQHWNRFCPWRRQTGQKKKSS